MKNYFKAFFLMLFLGLIPLGCEDDKDSHYIQGGFVDQKISSLGAVTFEVDTDLDQSYWDVKRIGLADSLLFYDNDKIGLALEVLGTEVASDFNYSGMFSISLYALSPPAVYRNQFSSISIRTTDTVTYPNYKFLLKGEDITDAFDFFHQESNSVFGYWKKESITNLDDLVVFYTSDYPFLFVPKYDPKRKVVLPIEVEVVTAEKTFVIEHILRID